jgi:hypothetical protein
MMATRREEQVVPQTLEAILAQPRREEAPAQAFPFVNPPRRVEPPAGGLPPPPAPTAAPAAPGAAAPVPAAGGTPQAAAEKNITIGVVCERCHEEMVRKTVAELSDERDQHIQGVVTGRYAT